MKEWKQIKDFQYEVSNEGEIRNMKTGRLLKGSLDSSGYLQVEFRKDGKRYIFSKHRLVAEAFVDGDKTLTVDHINCDKTDNRAENLRFISREENARKATSKRVQCIETGTIYNSVKEASEKTGVYFQSIQRVCRGERKTAGKLHWQYI